MVTEVMHIQFLHYPPTVDEMEAFNPVQKKLLLVTDTESNGACPSFPETTIVGLCIHPQLYCFIISNTVEDGEPIMMKPHDIDKDSAIGVSLFTGGKSTTSSEVSCFQTPLTSSLDLSLW